jgi:peroxiredoxin
MAPETSSAPFLGSSSDPRSTASSPPRWSTVALVALLVSNLSLLALNFRLQQKLADATTLHLKTGDVVPSLHGLDARGRALKVSFGDSQVSTLLLVFSPRCGWCDLNMPSWSALLEKARDRPLRTIAVATRQEGAAEYAERHQLTRASVMIEAEPKDVAAYKMVVTPQTILIGSTGRIERIWVGALLDDDLRDLERALGIELPAAPAELRKILSP